MPAVETIDYFGRRIVRWTVGPSTFVAAPGDGARLMSWNVSLPDGGLRDVIHWPDLRNVEDFARVRGGNPILFPFCARTFDAGDIHFWRDTAGVRRQMPMHGFARQGRFDIQRLHDAGFTAILQPTEADHDCFPYRYEFRVSYRFGPTSLAVELTLRNNDRQPVPWSAGHHFYFAVPWHEGRPRADYAIEIPAARAVHQLPTGRLSAPEPVPASESFASPALIDRIHLGLRNRTVRFGPRDRGDAVLLRVGADETPPDWATVVTWTHAAESPFFCVEPWMGPPNSPENKVGYHLVKPGATQSFLVEIDLA